MGVNNTVTHRLQLHNLTEARAGAYTCAATNSQGAATSNRLQVIILKEIYTPLPGFQITFFKILI